ELAPGHRRRSGARTLGRGGLGGRGGELLERSRQVRARLLFEARGEARRAVDRGPGEKARQHLRSALAKRGVRNPGVFAPDLLLVLAEPRTVGAEDRQVNVDEQSGVGA